jgi:hypothetical protein
MAQHPLCHARRPRHPGQAESACPTGRAARAMAGCSRTSLLWRVWCPRVGPKPPTGVEITAVVPAAQLARTNRDWFGPQAMLGQARRLRPGGSARTGATRTSFVSKFIAAAFVRSSRRAKMLRYDRSRSQLRVLLGRGSDRLDSWPRRLRKPHGNRVFEGCERNGDHQRDHRVHTSPYRHNQCQSFRPSRARA